MTRLFLVTAALVALVACGGDGSPASSAAQSPSSPTPSAPSNATGCARTAVGLTPLNDLAGGTYKGEIGGLYPGGSNVRPGGHEVAGAALARAVVPRDRDGKAESEGKYVLISIGMSNTTQEFSTFKQLADADLARDRHLVIVDGAQGGQTAAMWSQAGCPCWGVLDGRLSSAGVSAKQVSVAWIKMADASPTSGWPAYAQTLKNETAVVIRMLAERFPNLRLAYLSSRIYAGYATTALNPEPYAYESAFSVRWLIDDQLKGAPGLSFDSGSPPAPWLSWGPYLWADGLTPRSDGLTWSCSDLSSSDGTHPSSAGQRKVADLLLTFFRTDATARLWYLAR